MLLKKTDNFCQLVGGPHGAAPHKKNCCLGSCHKKNSTKRRQTDQKWKNGAGPSAAKFFVCFLRKRTIFANLWGIPTGQPLTRRIATWATFHKKKCYLGSFSQEELLLGKPPTRRIATWQASHKKNCYLASLSQEGLLLGKPFTKELLLGKPPQKEMLLNIDPGAPRRKC